MRKHIIFFLLILFLSTIISSSMSEETIILPQREFRGVWIASVGNIDWPSRKGLPVQEQQQELIQLLDICTALNLNAVIFQIRPAGDAFYDSKLEPWSVWLTGEQGQAPDPYYDPLEFAITESHKRGLELHAWFNPYRAGMTSQHKFAPNHISKKYPDLVYKYDTFYWMDPSADEIKQHTLNVILDVVRRYDVDGIHFDDYFYPYQVAGVEFPDSKTYSKYTADGGKLSVANWRRDNVNWMVQQVYLSILKEKPWVKFGISPFGIWQPGHPPGIVGLNSYATLYADSKKWLEEGWIDYLVPQLYWRIAAPGQSYPKLLQWWLDQNTRDRNIYAGNILSNIGPSTLGYLSPEASTQESVNEIKVTRERKALGNILFSMKELVRNNAKLTDSIKKEVYQRKALVPAMSWKRSNYPHAPFNVTFNQMLSSSATQTFQIYWESGDTPNDLTEVWRWAVYRQIGTADWELIAVLPRSETTYTDTFTLEGNAKDIKIRHAVTGLDRLSNESIPTLATQAE